MADATTIWAAPPRRPTLGHGEIHIWRARLDPSADAVQALGRMLSEDEMARADRFHFEQDRRRFVVARGLLRHILGRYLAQSPTTLQFKYGPRGKPALAAQPALHFNLSHAADVALYAFAQDRELGIDIEELQHDIEFAPLAQRFFSPRECEMLRRVPPHLMTQAFFNCWTRKEAYIKAIGEGLAFPLDCFDVSLLPGYPAQLLGMRNPSHTVEQWSMVALFPGPEFAAALVVAARAGQSHITQWSADQLDLEYR